jgi:hypothetical protein
VGLRTLRKLLQRRQESPADSKRAEVDQSERERERERDLLERVAAGIALNKTPGR